MDLLQFFKVKGFQILKSASLIAMGFACFQLLIHRWENYLSLEYPIKDEIQFVEKFNFLLENGWWASVVSGTSPVFNASVFLVNSLIKDPFLSMKGINVLSMLGVMGVWIYYLLREVQISSQYKLLSIFTVFYLTVVFNSFFSACNDSLFLFWVSLGICQLLTLFRRPRLFALIISGLGFSLALGTRELLIFYVPGIVIIITALLLSHKIRAKDLVVFVMIILVSTVLIYIPSLLQNGTLAFHDKNEGIYEGYWQEKNYLQLMLGKEGLSRAEVEAYKKANPLESLPKTYSAGMLMNPSLTLENAIRQLVLINKATFWKLGLVYLFFLGIVLKSLLKKILLSSALLVFLMFGSFSLAFALLPISRVEYRWFILFPLLMFVVSMEQFNQQNAKTSGFLDYALYVNFLVIGLLHTLLIGVW